MTLLVACGLRREARIFTRAEVVGVAGGADAVGLEAHLEAALECFQTVSAVLSAGIAGALDPTLTPGDVVIGTLAAVSAESPLRPFALSEVEARDALGTRGARTSTSLSANGSGAADALLDSLTKAFPHARHGTVVGSDTIVATLAQKRALYEATGALAVDMESHIAARVAARHALPFAILRTISDGANHVLPPAALVGMKPDGGMALGAVLASLARHPSQLPALVRTARDAGRAFKALERAWTSFEI